MKLKSEERSDLALPTSSDEVPATIDAHNVSLIDAFRLLGAPGKIQRGL